MVNQTVLLVCLFCCCVVAEDVQQDLADKTQNSVDIEEKHHNEGVEDFSNKYTDTGQDTSGHVHVQSEEISKVKLKPEEEIETEEIKNETEISSDLDESSESNSVSSDTNEESVIDSTKDFSLTNFIKSWLNPVLQEFQLGLNVANKDKNETTVEILNTTQLSNETSLNSTEIENKNITDIGKRVKFNCTGRNVTENTTAIVRLVNSSVLLDFLSFDKKNDSTDCIVIMFYAPWCKFCARTAAQFNALGRAFIQLDVLAVDAVHFSNLNARFGTVAVPNIMVFHNSRSAVRFNQTERTLEKLAEFVTNVTGLEPNKSVQVEEMDYIGPLSSIPTVETDYLLWCAWIFVLLCSSNMFIHSQYGQNAIEKVKTLWQEHQHIE